MCGVPPTATHALLPLRRGKQAAPTATASTARWGCGFAVSMPRPQPGEGSHDNIYSKYFAQQRPSLNDFSNFNYHELIMGFQVLQVLPADAVCNHWLKLSQDML